MDKITSGVTICTWKNRDNKILRKERFIVQFTICCAFYFGSLLACARYGNLTLFTFSLNQSANLFIRN